MKTESRVNLDQQKQAANFVAEYTKCVNDR